jgi:hypothetical protein
LEGGENVPKRAKEKKKERKWKGWRDIYVASEQCQALIFADARA